MPLLEIRNLQLEFGRGTSAVRVLDGVSLALEPGEILGLVGESGSGKSLTALSIAGLVPQPPARYPEGEIWLDGRSVLQVSARELRRLRGGVVSYVFQEPAAALNPVLRIGSQVREALATHRLERANPAEVIRWLALAGIPAPEDRARCYPHELSGGLQQRALIAMALASEPKLLVADEPTTALDATQQLQVLERLKELCGQLGMAILFISHNLGLVAGFAHRVAVMYAGQIVESLPAANLARQARHPYTRALLEAMPELGGSRQALRPIPGIVPQPGEWPDGCRFHPRCPRVRPECRVQKPVLDGMDSPHAVRCPFWALPQPESPAQTPSGRAEHSP